MKSQGYWFETPQGLTIALLSTPKTAIGYAPPQAIAKKDGFTAWLSYRYTMPDFKA
ncbi:hypothetical protein [Nostoc favosum]|uniref:Uncharacterized protein n=1 Tax=Nostoc favosum CHAB5714 TaxID=2780399 RepID=A0ABS8IAS6_9NOSO|nr:hypothetical protein [Nostoc favosum]MCC5600607.1 hypothetical protein [Nostoc favosum CHAB5714]